ncbi:zinc transporter ZIP4-like isoform X2 [Betta splendens]|uniref:Zinc transporter ZIP4 n=1 Tax=Betta splendens TaxID=158456 RepID=A0A6P7NV38_BETSP|nr:zinc transporter ZIP4-like isoform X2 [Betta splendens]
MTWGEGSLKMFVSALLLLSLFAHSGRFGSGSGSAAAQEAVGSIASPGQHPLAGASVRSLFNTLEQRVQCGAVSCEKCNLTGAVHQLIDVQDQDGGNISISAPTFPSFAAGCLLYLSSPELVCSAIGRGRWGAEARQLLDSITRQDHRHMDVDGLEVLLQELDRHYEPALNESCVTASDIMTEVSAPGERTPDAGAALGSVLYRALRGDCFVSRPLPDESFFLDDIMARLGSENFTVEELRTFMRTLNIGPDSEENHDHEHQSDESSHHNVRENSTWAQRCFSAEELLRIHGLVDKRSSGLGRAAAARLSPAFVQQILGGACAGAAEPALPDGLTRTERYVYATIANAVITLVSMFGIVLLLCTSCTGAFQLCVQFCISLAVGSLTGDALLHLLPAFLGLHGHADGGGGGREQPEIPDYIYKMLVVMSGIYYFYLMETVFSIVTYKNSLRDQHHHAEESEPHHCDHGKVLEMYQQEKKQRDQTASKADLVADEDEEEQRGSKKRTRQQRLLPVMITLGDGIHNFADGLAMGAAFSLSWRSGLATSLAVLCHELPHELGDFAILLHSGVPVRRALLLNVASAMTSFVGLYIALSVATDAAAQHWIGAVAAGLFLYVGLADMLPTMVHVSNHRPWLMFLLQNVGLLLGWGILLVLALYEERISF